MSMQPAAYQDDAECLSELLTLLALRLRREVAMVRALRRTDRNEAFLGLFLSEADAQAILDEIAGTVGVAGGAGHDELIEGESLRIRARLAVTPGELALPRIGRLFGLCELSLELIAWCAAPAIDDRFGRVYGFLQDDMGRRGFTLSLARMLFADRGVTLAELRGLLAPGGALRRSRLIRCADDDAPLASAALAVDERIVDLLLGRAAPAADLDRCEPLVLDAGAVSWYADDALLERATRVREPVALDLSRGGDGGLFAAAVAVRRGLSLRRFDWQRWSLVPAAEFEPRLAAALRDARLDETLPLLEGFDTAPPAAVASVVRLADEPVLLAAGSGSFWQEAGARCATLHLPPPSREARTALWAGLLAAHAPDCSGLATDLASNYALPAHTAADLVRQALGEVPDRASAPAAAGGDGGGPALAAALRDSARSRAGRAMLGVAQRIDTPFGFDDLVLPRATLALLQDLVGWRRTASQVLDEWGLGRVFGRGRGLTTLFSGPSGTGKTMAASVIANTLGLALFRVDLAGVVSKYIGETEKNLDRVFDAAARSDVVLFFDEADALFGKRSEVADAHDRYANIEVSYLLQRVECFDGIAVLASNLGQNLDDAFLRRIDMRVEFPAPGPADRARLWSRLTTAGAPIAEDVDIELLARKFELTGGEIRNCAVAGAQLAAQEDTAIAMHHLVRAIGREYVKIGQPIRRAVFGDFYGELRSGGGAR